MPELLGGWLTKARGWTFALAMGGGILLFLWWLDIPPFNRASDDWLILAVVLLAFGLTSTAVGCASSAWPTIAKGGRAAVANIRTWNRRRTPLTQLRRLTASEKSALAWLLANDQGVDATMTPPFAGLVESGFLIPQLEQRFHRPRAMLISPQAVKRKEDILRALELKEAAVQQLRVSGAPWLNRNNWMA